MSDKLSASDLPDFLLLGNTYDRKARLAPGLIVTLPITVALTFVAGATAFEDWYEVALIGLLSQLSLTVVFGYVAHSAGSGTEYDHMTDPHGPLISFLCKPQPAPDGRHGSTRIHSEKQQDLWRKAASEITEIDLCEGGKTSADDAYDVYKRLVVSICGQAEADRCMAAAHGEEYGFARNIVTLSRPWMGFSAAGLLATVYVLVARGMPSAVIGVAFEALFVLAALSVYWNGRGFIESTGERFVESLLDRAADKMEKPEPATPQIALNDAKTAHASSTNPPPPAPSLPLSPPVHNSYSCLSWKTRSPCVDTAWRAVYPASVLSITLALLVVGLVLQWEPSRFTTDAENEARRTVEHRVSGSAPNGRTRMLPVSSETAIAEKERICSLDSSRTADRALEMMTVSGAFRYRYYYSYHCLSETGTVLSHGVVAVYKRGPNDEWQRDLYSADSSTTASP